MLQAGLLNAMRPSPITVTTTVSYAASGLADDYVMMPQRPASYAASDLSDDYIMMTLMSQLLVSYAASGLADVYVMMSQRLSLMLQAGLLMIL